MSLTVFKVRKTWAQKCPNPNIWIRRCHWTGEKLYRWLLSLYLHPFAFPHSLSYVVFFFFFFFPHIIISMLQEGLSSRSCSIDPTYQTSLTYCFFQRNRFHICNCYSMHVGKSISVWLDLFSFSKEFILSYMATNYWVSDLRIGYAVKTFCSSSSSCFVCLFVFFFCFVFFFVLFCFFFFFWFGLLNGLCWRKSGFLSHEFVVVLEFVLEVQVTSKFHLMEV